MRAYRLHLGEEALVYRLAYNGDVVAFKMGRRRDPAWPISTRFRNVWHGRDAPETIDDQRRCTGCRYRTIYGGSRGSASLPAPAKWLGPITPTVYTKGLRVGSFLVRTFLGQERFSKVVLWHS